MCACVCLRACVCVCVCVIKGWELEAHSHISCISYLDSVSCDRRLVATTGRYPFTTSLGVEHSDGGRWGTTYAVGGWTGREGVDMCVCVYVCVCVWYAFSSF